MVCGAAFRVSGPDRIQHGALNPWGLGLGFRV